MICMVYCAVLGCVLYSVVLCVVYYELFTIEYCAGCSTAVGEAAHLCLQWGPREGDHHGPAGRDWEMYSVHYVHIYTLTASR